MLHILSVWGNTENKAQRRILLRLHQSNVGLLYHNPEPKRAFEGEEESGDKCESVDMFQDQMAFHYFGISVSKRGDATIARRLINEQPFGIAAFMSDHIFDFTLRLVVSSLLNTERFP